jgi:hypothetical protein
MALLELDKLFSDEPFDYSSIEKLNIFTYTEGTQKQSILDQ